MKRTKDCEKSLLEAFQDPEEALAYLNAALMDEDQEVFLLALKHVLKAQGVDNQNIYEMLSKKNLRWHNFRSIIDAMGLQIRFEKKHKQ